MKNASNAFKWVGIFIVWPLLTANSFAGTGSSGAAFLDIPVGAAPAALGGAYAALATDAYAPIYNPAGLAELTSTQLAGEHLDYLDTLHYEQLSVVHPFKKSGLGASIQYLGTGDVDGTDRAGNSMGEISAYYASYNLAYGHRFGEHLSLGFTGKLIQAKLADSSAHAYAMDLGSLYTFNNRLTLAASMTNLGSKLTFIQEGDPLPLAFHVGAAYQPADRWRLSSEAVVPKDGLASVRIGGEWSPLAVIALRAGYRTDVSRGLSFWSGVSTGLGVKVWGQELAYAFLPYGELGSTHYVSMKIAFGKEAAHQRNMIQIHAIRPHKASRENIATVLPETDELEELLIYGSTERFTRKPSNSRLSRAGTEIQ